MRIYIPELGFSSRDFKRNITTSIQQPPVLCDLFSELPSMVAIDKFDCIREVLSRNNWWKTWIDRNFNFGSDNKELNVTKIMLYMLKFPINNGFHEYFDSDRKILQIFDFHKRKAVWEMHIFFQKRMTM
jgi:hypothetical protein